MTKNILGILIVSITFFGCSSNNWEGYYECKEPPLPKLDYQLNPDGSATVDTGFGLDKGKWWKEKDYVIIQINGTKGFKLQKNGDAYLFDEKTFCRKWK